MSREEGWRGGLKDSRVQCPVSRLQGCPNSRAGKCQCATRTEEGTGGEKKKERRSRGTQEPEGEGYSTCFIALPDERGHTRNVHTGCDTMDCPWWMERTGRLEGFLSPQRSWLSLSSTSSPPLLFLLHPPPPTPTFWPPVPLPPLNGSLHLARRQKQRALFAHLPNATASESRCLAIGLNKDLDDRCGRCASTGGLPLLSGPWGVWISHGLFYIDTNEPPAQHQRPIYCF